MDSAPSPQMSQVPATGATPDQTALEVTGVNTLRFLSVNAVEPAKSSYPGLPMGAALMAYVLRTQFLRHNLANLHWLDRDRFVLCRPQ